MWKPTQPGSTAPDFDPNHPVPCLQLQPLSPSVRTPVSAGDQATIGKGPHHQGRDHRLPSRCLSTARSMAASTFPGNRVTVGRNGQVTSSINAREIVILGKVRGNVSASDRVDIRAEGALTGDVAAARISIEDGAFFKGGIDIRKAEAKPSVPSNGAQPRRSAQAGSGITAS